MKIVTAASVVAALADALSLPVHLTAIRPPSPAAPTTDMPIMQAVAGRVLHAHYLLTEAIEQRLASLNRG